MSRLIPTLLMRAGINYLLRHPWQLLLALTGISMGVALVLSVDIANSAAQASFEASSAQLRGTATHRIVSDLGRVDQTIYTHLVKQPGMPALAPIIAAKVRIAGQQQRLQLIGMDIFAENNFNRALAGVMNNQPRLDQWLLQPDAAMLSRSAATALNVEIDDTIEVQYQGKRYMLKVTAISHHQAHSSRSLVVVDIATAQAITGFGNDISYIDIRLDGDDATMIGSKLPDDVTLVDIGQQTEAILGLSAAFELNLTAMSLLGMLVGIFLIYNAISFSVVQRRNLLGRLRALGVSSTQIYSVILFEAFVLGVVGTAIGIALGALLGQQLTTLVAATVSELYFEVTAQAVSIDTLALVKAIVLGIAGTLIAAWLPALQAARTQPLTTLSRAALEASIHAHIPTLALSGCALIGIGLGICFVLTGGVISGFIGLFVIIIGGVLLMPFLLSSLSRRLASIWNQMIWQMAVTDLNRHISRLATATAALMLALSTSIGVAMMVDSMRLTVADWLTELVTGDLYIAAEGVTENATLPNDLVTQLIQLDGVDAYSLYRNVKLQIAAKPRSLIAADLSPVSRLGFDFIQTAPHQVWDAFDQGAVIISEPLAYHLQLTVGENINLLTRNGKRAFKVAGIFKDFASEHGRLFMHLPYYQQQWHDQQINSVALLTKQLSPSALEQVLEQTITGTDKLIVTRSKEIIAESMAIFERTFRITEVLRYLSICVAVIGIFSALMAILLERQKEFAILRAIGVTQLQITQLILLESLLLGLIAALLAVPVGLTMAWILTDVIQYRAFGWSMPLQLTIEPLIVSLSLGVAAALGAALYPAWLASRRNPAPRLRED